MGEERGKMRVSRQRITHILLLCAIVSVGVMGYVDHLTMTAADVQPAKQDVKRNVAIDVVGTQMPKVVFETIDGASVDIENYRGKTIVLHFWATWCVPCVKEFPELLKMSALAGDNVVLLTVSNDRDGQAVQKFLQRVDKENLAQGGNVVLAIDPMRTISQEVFQSYKLPETILVSPSFEMVKKIVGAETLWSEPEMLGYLKGL